MKAGYKKTVLAGAIALTMCAGISPPAFAYTVTHDYTMGDVQGGFDGSTYGPNGLVPNVTEILCMDDNTCDVQDDDGTVLYPIDSEFGFYVEDFVGAEQKIRDGVYSEGHIGNIPGGGIMVSNAATDKFKVKYPMGTWCAGLGGNSVKCSTEHYTVLEAVMTCNETVPYWYTSGDGSESNQAPLYMPGPEGEEPVEVDPPMTCANGALVDELFNVVDGMVTANPLMPDPLDPSVPDLVPNESTVLYDIAVSPDYGMTKKDDGKPLYRFGNMIKRPNDIRLYARMELPAEWKEPGGEDIVVTKATLTIEHNITNNPNDQIRPEDMENEGATGRLPEATIGLGGNLVSANTCYEGDGDPIPAGTIFKNEEADLGDGDGVFPSTYAPKPYPYSADLVGGYTNGWFTTTDRDPFANVESTDVYSGSDVGDPGDIALGGPRWRLRPNKFGQDIPGLEIPAIACSPVPYSHNNIRYEVGELTTMTINLLDWEEGEGGLAESPLARAGGWIDASQNVQNITEGAPDEFANTNGNGLSINGAPITDDFDLLVYVKGDRKATALYTATLDIEYEGEGPVDPPADADLIMESLTASASTVSLGDTVTLTATVRNDHPVPVSAKIVLRANDSLGEIGARIKETVTINPGDTYAMTYDWIATSNAVPPAYVTWSTWVINLTTAEDTSNNRASTVVRVNP